MASPSPPGGPGSTPADVRATTAEIDRVVEEAYEQLAFPPGGTPRWDRFNALFAPGAVLALRVFPDDEDVSVLSLADYAQAQMRHGLQQEGYSETPGERRTVVVGDIAYVHQDFTMDFREAGPTPAVDVFSLARVGGTWRIVAVLSDMST